MTRPAAIPIGGPFSARAKLWHLHLAPSLGTFIWHLLVVWLDASAGKAGETRSCSTVVGPCLRRGCWIDKAAILRRAGSGEVAEWSIAPHSKCGIRATVSGVRIPPSPPVLPRPTFSAGFWRAEIANNHGLRAKTSALRHTRRDPKFSLSARLSPNLMTSAKKYGFLSV